MTIKVGSKTVQWETHNPDGEIRLVPKQKYRVMRNFGCASKSSSGHKKRMFKKGSTHPNIRGSRARAFC